MANLARNPLPGIDTTKLNQGGFLVFGTTPTDREMSVLAETFIHGGQQEAADCMDLSIQSVKNHMTNLYARLGVMTAPMAAVALGWMAFPKGLVKVHRRAPDPLPELPDVVRL